MSYSFDAVQALGVTIGELEKAWLPEHPPNGPRHGYVSCGIPLFLGELARVKKDPEQEMTFLDVGCGIGTKMVIAQQMGFHVWGFDVWGPYVERAKKLVPHPRVVWQADAFRFEDYSGFDVVYAFKPYRDDPEQRRLEKHIVSHMRSGALALFIGGDEVEGCEHIGGSLWRVP